MGLAAGAFFSVFGKAQGEAVTSDVFSLAALSPAPVLALKPAVELEPAPVPVLTSTPIAAPTSGPELESAAAPALEHEPALELGLAPSQTLELELGPGPGPSVESAWPPPVATENGLSREQLHILVFPPDLVAEQFTLMDAVSAGSSGRGGGWGFFLRGPVQIQFHHHTLQPEQISEAGGLDSPQSSRLEAVPASPQE